MTQKSITLLLYICRLYTKRLINILSLISVLLLVAKVLELLRTTSSHDIGLLTVFKLALYKTPYIFQKVAPLASMFASIGLLLYLNNNNELIAMKASGVSIYQFIIGPVTISFLLGIVFIFVLNPIAATMHGLGQRHYSKSLKSQTNLLNISTSNIWIKDDDYKSIKFLRAQGISQNGKVLDKVSLYTFDKNMKFVSRLEGSHAEIVDKNLIRVHNCYFFQIEYPLKYYKDILVDITISVEGIQEGFLDPQFISVLKMPKYIKIFSKAGLSAIKYQIYYINLILIPFQFIIYSLVGIIPSIGFIRGKGHYFRILVSILIGLVYFATSEILYELSKKFNQSIYIDLLAPVIILAAILVFSLMHVEEG